MPHVGVKRLCSGDGKYYGAEQDKGGVSMVDKKTQAVPGIRGGEDFGRHQDLAQSEPCDRHEPDYHHRSEYPADLGGAVMLKEEQRAQSPDRERAYQVLRL